MPPTCLRTRVQAGFQPQCGEGLQPRLWGLPVPTFGDWLVSSQERVCRSQLGPVGTQGRAWASQALGSSGSPPLDRLPATAWRAEVPCHARLCDGLVVAGWPGAPEGPTR